MVDLRFIPSWLSCIVWTIGDNFVIDSLSRLTKIVHQFLLVTNIQSIFRLHDFFRIKLVQKTPLKIQSEAFFYELLKVYFALPFLTRRQFFWFLLFCGFLPQPKGKREGERRREWVSFCRAVTPTRRSVVPGTLRCSVAVFHPLLRRYLRSRSFFIFCFFFAFRMHRWSAAWKISRCLYERKVWTHFFRSFDTVLWQFLVFSKCYLPSSWPKILCESVSSLCSQNAQF